MVKKRTPNKKSTAVLRMHSTSSVARVLASRHHQVAGLDIYVERKLTGKELVLKNENTGLRRVYVSNIPGFVTGENLMDLFSKFGEVEIAYVKVPSSIKNTSSLSQSKIYGFVTFYDVKYSQKVLSMGQVKFPHFEEEFEIKPFNKKSKKLTLDYYTNKSNNKVNKNTKKHKNSSNR
jgi:RNA recognition motif-containing protein